MSDLSNNNEIVTFTSLGGLGEIGMNSYIYSYQNRSKNINEHLMIDLGMGFNIDKITSLDVFFPDISYLPFDKIKALLITHGHEDHIGAIPYLIAQLNCPIYATSWTADLIREKLRSVNLLDKIVVNDIEVNQELILDNFKVTWRPILHSIIDANLLEINTPKGNIIHTGDFKLSGMSSEMRNNLAQIASKKITYLVCDSTNIGVAGHSKAENTIEHDITYLINGAKGVTWITLFSSNLERIVLITKIAQQLKKRIVIFGRSLVNYVNLAIKHNILDANFFIDEEEIANYDRKNLIFIVTGSQGENRSILYNVVIRNEFKQKIKSEDRVLFCSKVIPGNEKSINLYYNTLADIGIEYFTAEDYNIHTSGHAYQEEIREFYQLINPQYIIPMHGEYQHLREHVKFAISNGYKSDYFHVGEVVALFQDKLRVVDRFSCNKVSFEGNRLVSVDDVFLKERTSVFFDGIVVISLLINKKKLLLEDYLVDIIGLLKDDEKDYYYQQIAKILEDYFNQIHYNKELLENIEDNLKAYVRSFIKSKLTKKPMVKMYVLLG